jgi:hypothetical protein
MTDGGASSNFQKSILPKLTEQDSLMRRAACGCLQSQRELVMDWLLAAQTGGVTWSEGIRQAEHFARLAAAHGELQDHGRLLSILGLRADDLRSLGDEASRRAIEAEGIAIVSVLADEGNEDAAGILATLGDAADPEMMVHAKAMVTSWREAR